MRAGRREASSIEEIGMVEESAGFWMLGGEMESAGGVYVGERRDRESMKFPASRLVGERGTCNDMDMS